MNLAALDSWGMAAGRSERNAHMEEMVDQGLGMEETDQGLLRRPSLKETYHRDSLLAPDTDFMTGTELRQLTAGGPCPPKLLPHLCSFVGCLVSVDSEVKALKAFFK